MKLKEYAEKISKLAIKYPEAIIIYGSDDEGNSFQEIHYNPTAGQYEDGEFARGKGLDRKLPINAICIN